MSKVLLKYKCVIEGEEWVELSDNPDMPEDLKLEEAFNDTVEDAWNRGDIDADYEVLETEDEEAI